MASNYNSLGLQLMTTGEKAGTWGTETNTTWNEVRDMFGYITVAMTADRTLTIPDGSTGTYDGRAMIIECNGALGANRVLDIAVQAGSGSSPGGAANIEKPFIIFNNTSTAYTLTFKVTGATGFVLTQGSTYLCYHNGTDIVNTGLIGAATTDTLTNKTLTAPKFADGGFIADTTGAETLVFGEVSTPVNEVKITNAATGTAGPIIASQGESNSNLQLRPSGTGMITTGTAAAHSTISSNGAYNLILETNEGTSSGTITITDAANGDITLTPNGTGIVKATDAADATAAVKIAGTETMYVPATAMYAESTNGAEATQTVLTAGNPELKAFDFDTSTAEAVQFNVCFPKSWDAGTVTFQTFWSASATDTGTGGFTLAGCSVASDVDYDLAFGTAVANTALAASGTQDDLMVNVVSGAVTIASVADDTNTIFRLVRDTGTDTNTGDLRLVGVKIFYTTDAANDA